MLVDTFIDRWSWCCMDKGSNFRKWFFFCIPEKNRQIWIRVVLQHPPLQKSHKEVEREGGRLLGSLWLLPESVFSANEVQERGMTRLVFRLWRSNRTEEKPFLFKEQHIKHFSPVPWKARVAITGYPRIGLERFVELSGILLMMPQNSETFCLGGEVSAEEMAVNYSSSFSTGPNFSLLDLYQLGHLVSMKQWPPVTPLPCLMSRLSPCQCIYAASTNRIFLGFYFWYTHISDLWTFMFIVKLVT